MISFLLQAALAVVGSSPTAMRDCPDCPQMVRVTLTNGGAPKQILVAKYELTWAEYLSAVQTVGCTAPRNRSGSPIDWHDRALWDDYPMTSIQPNQIGCYINWINARTGKAYRLPTEAEWMAIATASGGAPGRGDYLYNQLHDLPVRHDPRSPVAAKIIRPASLSSSNALGINDLFGNAAEAVSDRPVPPQPIQSRTAKPIELVAVKGGYIGTSRGTDLVKSRMLFLANTLSDMIGFRLVRAVDDGH